MTGLSAMLLCAEPLNAPGKQCLSWLVILEDG